LSLTQQSQCGAIRPIWLSEFLKFFCLKRNTGWIEREHWKKNEGGSMEIFWL
jgi:hypothetical protein